MVRKKQMEDDIQRNGMNSPIDEDILVIRAEEQIMGTNADYAEKVCRILGERQIYCINLISSPGSGKTTLLVETPTLRTICKISH